MIKVSAWSSQWWESVRWQDGIGLGWNAAGNEGFYTEKDQSYKKHGKKKHESE